MRVLIVGDSITEGKLGVSYFPALSKRFPALDFSNFGIGGDTLYGIGRRLVKEVAKRTYDLIIIEAGHNDLLIPEMKQMNKLYQGTAYWLEFRGSHPTTDPSAFHALYRDILGDLRDITDVPVYITTLSCLGERLDTELNRKRSLYNLVIEGVAQECHCTLIDVAKLFNEHLEDKDQTDYLFGLYHKGLGFNNIQPAVDIMSEKRSLHLTVDGVHLNSVGASLYTEAIGNALAPLCDV